MALKGLVTKLSDKLSSTLSSKPEREPWQPAAGPYPLLDVLPDETVESVSGKSGVFVLWHRGVRPQWLFTGFAADIALAMKDARADADVQKYMLNEGVYVAWAFLSEAESEGVPAYLREQMQPALTMGALVEKYLLADEAPPTEFPMPVD